MENLEYEKFNLFDKVNVYKIDDGGRKQFWFKGVVTTILDRGLRINEIGNEYGMNLDTNASSFIPFNFVCSRFDINLIS